MPGTGDTFASATKSFTINGGAVTPTLLNFAAEAGGNTRGYVAAYALFTTAYSGAITMGFTHDSGSGSTNGAWGNTIAYKNAGSAVWLGGTFATSGLSINQTVTSAANRLIANLMVSFETMTTASYNRTLLMSKTAAGGKPRYLVGEAPGAASVNFTCPTANTTTYGWGTGAVDVRA